MSDKAPTPRTDKLWLDAPDNLFPFKPADKKVQGGPLDIQTIELARQLETELSAALEREERLKAGIEACATHLSAMARRNAALDPGVLAVAMDLRELVGGSRG